MTTKINAPIIKGVTEILSSFKGSEIFIIIILLKRSKVKINITKNKLKILFFNIN